MSVHLRCTTSCSVSSALLWTRLAFRPIGGVGDEDAKDDNAAHLALRRDHALAEQEAAVEARIADLDDREGALRSFRHHFRGIESQGTELDAEDLRILYALTRPLAVQ